MAKRNQKGSRLKDNITICYGNGHKVNFSRNTPVQILHKTHLPYGGPVLRCRIFGRWSVPQGDDQGMRRVNLFPWEIAGLPKKYQ